VAAQLTVADLLVRLMGDTASFNAAMAGAEAKMMAVSKSMSAAGRAMTMKLTLPLGIAGGAAIKMAADFQSSMQQIVGLVGIAQGQVDKWSGQIMKLPAVVGRSATELAKAMFFITSAGARGSVAMDILTASAKASAAGLGETKDVAFAAVSAVNAYGAANITAEQAVATLVATVREGNLEASALAPVLGRVLPIAAEMGVSFDQIGASIASMTRLGADAAESTTMLRMILAALIKPSRNAEEALKAAGTSFGEMRRKLREEGLLSVLMAFRDAMNTNSEAMAVAFPRIRALTGVLNLVGQNASTTQKIFKSLAGTTEKDLTRAFGVAKQTDLFKMQKALAEMKTAVIGLGDAFRPVLLPALEKLAEVMKTTVDVFHSMPAGMQKSVSSMIGLALAIGPVVWIGGRLVGLVGWLIGGLGGLTGSLGLTAAAMTETGAAAAGATTAIGGFQVVLAGVVGVASYKITKAILEATGAYAAMGKALGLVAKGPLAEFAASMAKNQEEYNRTLIVYNKIRKELGLTGEAWRVGAEWTKENATMLARLYPQAVKVEHAQKKLAAATRATSAANKDMSSSINMLGIIGPVVTGNVLQQKAAYEQLKPKLEAANQSYGEYIASLKQEFDLLSKGDISKQLGEMAKKYDQLSSAGINQKQISAAMGDELLRLLKLGKDYGITLPDSIKKFADSIAKNGNPAIALLADSMTGLPKYAVLGAGGMVKAFDSTGKEIHDSLSGGFGKGIEDGVKYGTQVVQDFKRNLESEVFKVKITPDLTDFKRKIQDSLDGRTPNDTGRNP